MVYTHYTHWEIPRPSSRRRRRTGSRSRPRSSAARLSKAPTVRLCNVIIMHCTVLYCTLLYCIVMYGKDALWAFDPWLPVHCPVLLCSPQLANSRYSEGKLGNWIYWYTQYQHLNIITNIQNQNQNRYSVDNIWYKLMINKYEYYRIMIFPSRRQVSNTEA